MATRLSHSWRTRLIYLDSSIFGDSKKINPTKPTSTLHGQSFTIRDQPCPCFSFVFFCSGAFCCGGQPNVKDVGVNGVDTSSSSSSSTEGARNWVATFARHPCHRHPPGPPGPPIADPIIIRDGRGSTSTTKVAFFLCYSTALVVFANDDVEDVEDLHPVTKSRRAPSTPVSESIADTNIFFKDANKKTTFT